MPPAACFKASELIDYDALKIIISNWDILPIDNEHKKTWKRGKKDIVPIEKLNEYKNGCKDDKMKTYATRNVKYNYSSNSTSEGRRFVDGACGLQSFARPIRHTLACRFYDDIDIKNCHPTILLQYCEKKGYECNFVKSYVESRDVYMSDLMTRNRITRDEAKKVILAIFNCGEDYPSRDYNSLEYKPQWLIDMKKQIEKIQQSIVNDKENERFVKRAKKSNVHGSTTNHLLCSIEDNILTGAISFLKMKGISVEHIVLTFDGFMLPKGSAQLTFEFLTDMSTYVCAATGYKVEYVVKPMDEVINLEGFRVSEAMQIDMIVVEDDNSAANAFIDHYNHIVKKSQGRIFAFNFNNTWTDNNHIVDNILLETCLNANIYKVGAKNEPKPYCGNVSGAKHVIEAVKAKLREEPDFCKKLWHGSIGKLYFQDGYWDFNKRTFVKSLAPEDSMTTVRLSYDFPVRDEKVIADFNTKVLHTIMPVSEIRETFLCHIARGIAGHYEDKNWIVGIGERNSGKGVLVSVNENTFENYCITLNSDSFLLERNSDGDQAKKLSWLLDCEFKRLLFTNEITIDGQNKKLNGNMIKGKLTSGGDTLKARRNYCDEVEFKIQGRLFMLCNDMPPITPPDAAETMHIVKFPHQFVENPNPDLKFQQKRWDDIKEYIKRPEVRDAYLHIILDAYRPYPVKVQGCVEDDTLKFRADVGDEWGMIRKAFKITKNDKDRVSSKEVTEWAKSRQLNISSQKLRMRLESLGAQYSDNIKIHNKKSNGYKYLVKTEEPSSDSEVDD